MNEENHTHRGLGHHFIRSFEAKELRKRPFVIRIADKLTQVFGSIPFFVLNFLFFATWIAGNSGYIPAFPIFDPYPFTFLTMSVSLEAIALAIIVLMSQTRQGYISTLREELDMQVNLVAEREITKILKLLKLLLDHNNIHVEDHEVEEMLKSTDVSYIEKRLEEELNTKSNSSIQQTVTGITKAVEKVGENIKSRVPLNL
jgi:uncharacterized membrane protein